MNFFRIILSQIIAVQIVIWSAPYAIAADKNTHAITPAESLSLIAALPDWHSLLLTLQMNLGPEDIHFIKQQLIASGISLDDKVGLTTDGHQININGINK